MNIAIATLAIFFLFTGCENTDKKRELTPVENVAKISLDMNWSEKTECSHISPSMRVSNVPKGTSLLVFKMMDRNATKFNHGGGEIKYSGDNEIAEGALDSFNAPCPPKGLTHIYVMSLKALDSNQTHILGEGSVEKAFTKR